MATFADGAAGCGRSGAVRCALCTAGLRTPTSIPCANLLFSPSTHKHDHHHAQAHRTPTRSCCHQNHQEAVLDGQQVGAFEG
eukprot:364595-Chlamydomonas_euryale.AAC.2